MSIAEFCEMSDKSAPSLDYAIHQLEQESRRLDTERQVALHNKDPETAQKFEWLLLGVNRAIELLKKEEE
jgi:hypothetical protein